MELYFAEEEQVQESFLRTMEKAARLCVEEEGLDASLCAASVSFVDREQIQQLNRDFRGIDQVTDVLSFPQYEDVASIQEELSDVDPDAPILEIGDVVICQDRAKEQAEEFGHSLEREMIYLFTHSILHLLGYEHMEDEEKKVMRAREEAIMDQLGIPRR